MATAARPADDALAPAPYAEQVDLVLVCAGILAAAGLVAVPVVLRRRGGHDRDLVAGQMQAVADARSVPTRAAPGAPAESPATDLWDGLDEVTRRRVEQSLRSGARLSAINLIRESAGCSLAQAKAVVDRLGATPHASPRRPAPARVPGPARATDPGRGRFAKFPPGFDIDLRRPADEPGPEPDAARRILEQALELAYRGRMDEAARLLHERAGMSLIEAQAAVGRLTTPGS